jgi:uncharacterized membrane protein YdjX (TVP38/TMEM64 family)
MKPIGTLLALTLIVLTAFLFQEYYPRIIQWLKTLGWLAPVLFLVLYGLATILFLPTLVLTLAGGALFGPVLGTLLNLLGASIGAAGSFYISRYFMFGWIASKNNSLINQLILKADQRGWQFVALLRLLPIIPFNIVNFSLGMTRIKFSHYIITTIIFLIPAEIIFTYCGHAGMNMLNHDLSVSSNLGLFLLVSMAVLWSVKRSASLSSNV